MNARPTPRDLFTIQYIYSVLEPLVIFLKWGFISVGSIRVRVYIYMWEKYWGIFLWGWAYWKVRERWKSVNHLIVSKLLYAHKQEVFMD